VGGQDGKRTNVGPVSGRGRLTGTVAAAMTDEIPRAARRRTLAAAATAALAISLAAASTAIAASTVSVSGDTITLDDGVGERNYVTVNHGNNPSAVAHVDDHAGIAPVPPCFPYAGLGFTCPTTVRPAFVLDLAGGDDFAQVINSAAAGTHSELRGGDGNDQLWSYEGSDTLDGGAGDDELRPDGDQPSPGDDVRGGPGTDHLQLAPALSSEVIATLDGKPNDGQPGHGDNYRSDVENVTGAQTARNTIVGAGGPNILTGQGQADRLTGAGGRDSLDGREGSDTIDALDGNSGDRIACGGGADVAYADAGDVVAGDCEKTIWAPAVSSARLRYRDKRIGVRLKCPRASRTSCAGRVRLATRTGRKLATARYKARRGKTTTIALRVKRRPAPKVSLTIAPKGTSPTAGRAVRVR
jgi:Ca2+-binding RTX toxin-like protein